VTGAGSPFPSDPTGSIFFSNDVGMISLQTYLGHPGAQTLHLRDHEGRRRCWAFFTREPFFFLANRDFTRYIPDSQCFV